VPGDWVVSARFGAVRLLSVRDEPAARPVPVFNLSVASSHAYFVGTNRVLVHNTNCQPNASESHTDAIQRLIHDRDELNRQIKDLTRTTPGSSRIAELRAERDAVQRQIDAVRDAQRRGRGAAPTKKDDETRQKFETESEAQRKAIEDAKRELAELERRPRTSEAEEAAFAARKAELEGRIQKLEFSHARTQQILTWLRELAEAESTTPATDAERRALDEKKNELRANIKRERTREVAVNGMRKRRAAPEAQDKRRAKQTPRGLACSNPPTIVPIRTVRATRWSFGTPT
jgi:chromosome segregation ATPase